MRDKYEYECSHPQPFVRNQSLQQSTSPSTHYETGPEVSCIYPLARSTEILETITQIPTQMNTTQSPQLRLLSPRIEIITTCAALRCRCLTLPISQT